MPAKKTRRKKRVFCMECKFYDYRNTSSGWSEEGYQLPSFKDHICDEPHKIYTYSALTKIDSSNNCFVRNDNNDCEYYRRKKT